MRYLILAAAPLLISTPSWAHDDDSVECYTKAEVVEVRGGRILANGEMKCESGDRKARTRVFVAIKDLRGWPVPAGLIGQKVKIETDNSEETGEICLGDHDELLIGSRVAIYVMDDVKGYPARMRRIYGGRINEDGEILTEKRFLAVREHHKHHHHRDVKVVRAHKEHRREVVREPVIKK